MEPVLPLLITLVTLVLLLALLARFVFGSQSKMGPLGRLFRWTDASLTVAYRDTQIIELVDSILGTSFMHQSNIISCALCGAVGMWAREHLSMHVRGHTAALVPAQFCRRERIVMACFEL